MSGKVVLVGAGPGDAGLMTIKGCRELQRADVVVYDRLVDEAVLAMIPPDAERINVGKRVADHPVPQHEINRILRDQALEGKRVVRLKGGDCFVFGRGGEELELLREAGVAFEVVPGITSALAAAAYAGIPVTHRDFCASVHIIAGHRKQGAAQEMDFDALTRLGGTLVFLMSVATFGEIARGLIDAGMPVDMPCAIVENGTRPEQRKLLTTIGAAAQCVLENRVCSPAIFVVGSVCALSERMDWFDRLPLKGRRVLVVSSGEESCRLTQLLGEQGARTIELPAPLIEWISFELPHDGCNLILPDADAVEALFVQLEREKKDARALAGLRLVCESERAERALRARGMYPDAAQADLENVRLCAQGESGLAGYRRRCVEPIAQPQADFAVFLSPESVETFQERSSGWDLTRLKAVCAFEETAIKARGLGMKTWTAAQPTAQGVLEAMLQADLE